MKTENKKKIVSVMRAGEPEQCRKLSSLYPEEKKKRKEKYFSPAIQLGIRQPCTLVCVASSELCPKGWQEADGLGCAEQSSALLLGLLCDFGWPWGNGSEAARLSAVLILHAASSQRGAGVTSHSVS